MKIQKYWGSNLHWLQATFRNQCPEILNFYCFTAQVENDFPESREVQPRYHCPMACFLEYFIMSYPCPGVVGNLFFPLVGVLLKSMEGVGFSLGGKKRFSSSCSHVIFWVLFILLTHSQFQTLVIGNSSVFFHQGRKTFHQISFHQGK